MDSVSISLDRNDWGQIVDALEARRTSWEVTARYLEGEEVDQAIEECRDAEEARALVSTYDRLIGELRAPARLIPHWRMPDRPAQGTESDARRYFTAATASSRVWLPR